MGKSGSKLKKEVEDVKYKQDGLGESDPYRNHIVGTVRTEVLTARGLRQNRGSDASAGNDPYREGAVRAEP